MYNNIIAYIMGNQIVSECLEAIMDANSIGYSFVKTFVDVLWKHKDSLRINNYVVLWKVHFNDFSYDKEFAFYSNNQEFDLSSLDVEKLYSCYTFLTSDSEEFKKLYLNKSLGNSHVVAIPITNHSKEKDFFQARCVVLLFSQQGKINFEKEDLGAISYLLNSRKPCALSDLDVIESLANLSLSEDKTYDKYTECFKHIGDSLDNISSKKTKLGAYCGLRHFSIWNYIHANKNLSTKIFSRNTYNDNAHDKTNMYVQYSDSHFINDALVLYEKKYGLQILKCHSLNEVEKTFEDIGYLHGNNLDDANTTVLTVADGDVEFELDYPDRILNFYVANIIYTPFISKSFIQLFSKSITNCIRKCLVSCRDNILTNLMDASIECEKEMLFYRRAIDIIKSANEAEDVLIYLKDKDKYDLKCSEEQLVEDKFLGLKIPAKYKAEKNFIDWLKNSIDEEYINAFYINTTNKVVTTSAFMKASSDTNERECLIVLINKHHVPSMACVYYNNIFDKDNYYITAQCCVFLIQYQKMKDSIKNKNYLLHKLRHEIPSCTEAIDNGLKNLNQALDASEISRKHVFTISKNIALNNSRVLLLAKFFSTVDFEPEQFAKDKININIGTFLSSYIEIFRTEGQYKGVDVYFEMKETSTVIVQASNYFQLAIVNVITNAIRYAACGTCVCIDIYKDKIVVRDLGIGILQKEKELIFNEGYRGQNAKRTNEKGMGYGLFLTQKVLSAHGFSIEVDSSLFSDRNYFAQAAVMRYLNSMSMDEKMEFVLRDMEEMERPLAMNILRDISNSQDVIAGRKDYANVKMETIRKWMAYITENSEIFYEMDQDYFQEELHEVSFTIKFK